MRRTIDLTGSLPVGPEFCAVEHGSLTFFDLLACDSGTLIVDTMGSQIDTVLGIFNRTNL